jgi:hypothetical protein
VALLINGFDLSDDTADWYGWEPAGNWTYPVGRPGPAAHGYVAPAARAAFFAEVAAATATIDIEFGSQTARTLSGRWLYNTDADIVATGNLRWTYGGDNPSMMLTMCCGATRLPYFEPALLGVACSRSGSNFASDHPAWAGDNEELVQITAASGVPAGATMIAVASWNQTHSRVEQVYDQRGNAWTLDAEHETTGSSQDDTVQIWRCNVTNAIAAGDYIRLAFNVGSSLLTTTEAGGRCLGVYAFGGTLSVATVGTGVGGFSTTPAISTPAGDVVVAGLSVSNDTAAAGLTPDGDWSAMIPATDTEGGVGNDASMLFAQQLAAAGATTWTPTLAQTRDWAAIAVGYTRS